MMRGTIYGVALNDAEERGVLTQAFAQPPYRAPPAAPVLYIKSRNTVVPGGGETGLDGLTAVRVAATIGLVFGRDAACVRPEAALGHIAAAALVLDLSEPWANYYRPAVRQSCRDGFLPVGALAAFHPDLLGGEIVTRIDGAEVHRWSPARLVRDAATLIADVSAFMTLAAGDTLLIGLPHDAPTARAGQRLEAHVAGLASVTVTLRGQS
jgi:5-oxopent-3-ene-1,2,5-tricarboxylate decarboxylase/2-hydroxyhepta-2,4-diene-1,7-dioate isomerase